MPSCFGTSMPVFYTTDTMANVIEGASQTTTATPPTRSTAIIAGAKTATTYGPDKCGAVETIPISWGAAVVIVVHISPCCKRQFARSTKSNAFHRDIITTVASTLLSVPTKHRSFLVSYSPVDCLFACCREKNSAYLLPCCRSPFYKLIAVLKCLFRKQ